jgi:DNA (cytosine-5)-methyltransferase 1
VGNTIGEGLQGHNRNEYNGHEPGRIGKEPTGPIAPTSSASRMADTASIRLWLGAGGQIEEGLQPRPNEAGVVPSGLEGRGFTNGYWSGANWVYCADPDGAKWRPVKPGTFPLADRAPGRVALLRGAGNAISPWAAKAFIESYLNEQKPRQRP